MHIDSLVIETTRKCTLKCRHCLRGEAQPKNFNELYLVDFIHNLNIESIGCVTLTGGEPSMVPAVLTSIRKVLNAENIEVQNFYLATNGYGNNDREFIMELMEWYLFCSDNEISRVDVSNDNYHANNNDLGLLDTLSFAGFKHDEGYSYNDRAIINEGNATLNGIGARDNTPYPYDIEEDIISEGMFYINCEGYIFSCCDLSYLTMANKEESPFFVGTVDNISLDNILSYNDSLD